MEERAATFGARGSLQWRLVGLAHVAETEEQARRDVEHGIEQWFRYFQSVAAFPQMAVEGGRVSEMIDFINGSGLGAIGTPDQVATQIERLQEQSKGGFGAYLLLAHEWANPQATRRSYELIAQEVLPRFQGQAQTTLDAAQRAREARPELAADAMKAVEAMNAKHQAAVARARRARIRAHGERRGQHLDALDRDPQRLAIDHDGDGLAHLEREPRVLAVRSPPGCSTWVPAKMRGKVRSRSSRPTGPTVTRSSRPSSIRARGAISMSPPT